MDPVSTQSLRRAAVQQLEADQLFGVYSVPITKSVVQNAKPAAPSQGRSVVDQKHRAKENSPKLKILNESHVEHCTKCPLSKTRTRTVFGQGNAAPRLVFVGEAPGYEEDKQGLAFVGRAGQLLSKMIEAMGLSREEVFICNVLKCRPPNNRDPSASEILACSPHLRAQLDILEPEVLIALGAPAAKTLLNSTEGIGRLRGRFHDYYPSGITGQGATIPLMPTYHPAYLLRSPGEKRKAWDDLQMVMARLGLPQR